MCSTIFIKYWVISLKKQPGLELVPTQTHNSIINIIIKLQIRLKIARFFYAWVILM